MSPLPDVYADCDPRAAFARAVAELPDTPPAAGYRDARSVFAGVLEWCRQAGPLAPVTLEGLSELVLEHAMRAAYGDVEFSARASWGMERARIRSLVPHVRRRQGYAALVRLARGAL